MKYLKSHRIYERFGRQMLALFNKLREAFKDTKYAINLDEDRIIVGIRGKQDKILSGSIYYNWDIDEFTENEIKSTINERHQQREGEAKDISVEIGNIIIAALEGHVNKPVEWWDQYVNVNVADSKLYDVIETNLKAHPDWIMKPEQVQGFFQDVIDDIDEDKYSWEFEIGMIFQNKITWCYKLTFKSEMDLNRNNHTKSLQDFNTLLSSVHRACKRIEQEENIHTFVGVTGKNDMINHQIQTIQARITLGIELIHGEIIDLNYTDEPQPRMARPGPR